MKIKSFQKCILLVLLSIFTVVAFFTKELNSSNIVSVSSKVDLMVLTPDSTSYQGYFYTEKGKFLGSRGNEDSVYITSQQTYDALVNHDSIDLRNIYSLSEFGNITHSDFLNRVNWTFGEGGGVAADYYASAINNMAMKMGEHGMYVQMNEGEKGTPSQNIQKYFFDYEGANSNYRGFKNYRNYITNQGSLNKKVAKNLAYYEHATEGNIRILSGKVTDPTEGAINKVGGKRAIEYALLHNVEGQKMVVVKFINKTTKYTSYHVFFELGKKRDKALSEYTLVTIENFNKIEEKIVPSSSNV